MDGRELKVPDSLVVVSNRLLLATDQRLLLENITQLGEHPGGKQRQRIVKQIVLINCLVYL